MFCYQLHLAAVRLPAHMFKVQAGAVCVLFLCVFVDVFAAPSALYSRDTNSRAPGASPPAIVRINLPDPDSAETQSSSSSLGALLNINTASVNELADALPGIGPSKAQAIVDWREQYGLFTHPEQLLDVPGIGPVTLGNIRPLIFIGEGQVPSANADFLPQSNPSAGKAKSEKRVLPLASISAIEAQTRQDIALIIKKVKTDATASID